MYWEATTKAKKTEAVVQLEKLKKAAIEEYNANSAFPQQPAATTPAVDCCTQNAGGKKKCAPVAADWQVPEWRALAFSMNEDFLFQYAYQPANAGASFQATATGDTNCNGTKITYTLDGAMVGGAPKITLTEPANSD